MAETSIAGGTRPARESIVQPAAGGSPGRVDVQVTAVTVHGWRVVDAARPLHDPSRLLAFIEQRDDVFEVMQLGSGFEWHAFDSMQEAVAFVVETGPRLAQERLRSDLSWVR